MKKGTFFRQILSLAITLALILGLLPIGTGNMEAQAAQTAKTETVNGKTYKVILPDGYSATGSLSYPVLYLMPEDGLSAYSQVMMDKIAEMMKSSSSLEMIVVQPTFAAEDNFVAQLAMIADDVDSKYHTIATPQGRAVAGIGTGGYMAYISGLSTTATDPSATMHEPLTKPEYFGAMASMRGNFTGEDNPWKNFGNVYTELISVSKPADLNNFYTYLDAPSEDAYTTMENSTNTIGSWFINNYSRLPYSVNEFTVRSGAYDDAYVNESISRLMDRLSNYFVKDMLSGTFKLSKTTVKEDESSITGAYSIQVSDKMADFTSEAPEMTITLSMTDPATGASVTENKTTTVTVQNTENPITGQFEVPNVINDLNTTCTLSATLFGKTVEIASANLVRIKSTGTKADEQVIDLMGDWHFNAYKQYSDKTENPLDDVANLNKADWSTWDIVQPGLGWWTADFASSLGGNSNWGGYAWYVREFDLPADFTKTGLTLAGGKFDEADAFYVNGVKVGATGIQEDGTYDGSNPWEVDRLYPLDSSILKYGQTNTIAVRMCNSSGGGGWYEGPIGIYSLAAYNKAKGKPSTVANQAATDQINAVVAKQNDAIEKGNLDQFAKTVDPEYFGAGTNKTRLLEAMSAYAGKAKIADHNSIVYTVDDLYLYQAERTYTLPKEPTEQDPATEQKITEDIEYYFKNSADGYILYGAHERFFYTKYQSEALNREMGYQVYLPEGYFAPENSAKRYPTLYLLHGLNSTSQTYVIDRVNEHLDRAIADGTLSETIVIIPDSSAMSWWADGRGGKFESMLTKDLLPTVDNNYRTIQDARFRGTAGCSMGGLGAYTIAVRNPNLFSSVVSFYGAFSYGGMGAGNPVSLLQAESADYANYFSHYLTCGNRDVYRFGRPAIEMDALLRSYEADHKFSIDNGEHDSKFYVPRFIEGLQWSDSHRYAPDAEIDNVMSNLSVTPNGIKDNKLSVSYALKVSKNVKNYLNRVPYSSYTADTKPELLIPITITVEQNGKTVASAVCTEEVLGALNISGEADLDCTDLDPTKNYTVKVAADLLGHSQSASSLTDMDLKNAKEKAAAVDKLIAAIGTVTANSGSAITAARKAYDALDAAAKTHVTKYQELVKAEQTYKNLSSPVTTPVGKVSGVKASVNTYNSLKITWKAVSGAENYEILRAASKNGSYKKIATVSSSKNNYTDKKLTCGNTYYYKVRAVNKTSVGAESNAAKAKATPPAPKVSVKKSGKSLKVSWKKVSGASGYMVYRSNKKKSGYKAVKTIKKGKTVSYSDNKVKRGKTYYYKVRAYTTVKGKKIQSPDSSPAAKKF